MTPEQAWNLLVSATAEINTNRAGHEKIKAALEALKPRSVEQDEADDPPE